MQRPGERVTLGGQGVALGGQGVARGGQGTVAAEQIAERLMDLVVVLDHPGVRGEELGTQVLDPFRQRLLAPGQDLEPVLGLLEVPPEGLGLVDGVLLPHGQLADPALEEVEPREGQGMRPRSGRRAPDDAPGRPASPSRPRRPYPCPAGQPSDRPAPGARRRTLTPSKRSMRPS